MDLNSKPKKNKLPLAELAYREIYKRIISLEYKPGQALEEKMLMEHLGIGRTPVREALFHLSTEFLVEAQPQKGFLVRPITLQSVKAMFEALKLLELGVVDLAVKQDVTEFLPLLSAANRAIATAVEKLDYYGLVEKNDDFHMTLARCTRNEYLVHAMQDVRCEANRLAYLSFSHEIGGPGKSLRNHYESVIGHHEELIENLRERNSDRLRELICDHIRAFQLRMVEYLTS